MKKILAFLLTLMLSINFTYAEENNNLAITSVDSTNANLLKLFVDNDIQTNSSDLEADLKLFQNLEIENISIDLDNNKLVHINLNEELEKNTSYSILPITGIEAGIDFKTEENLNGIEINGTDLDGVEKLTIEDSKHLNIFLKNEVDGDNIELKILKEYNVNNVKLNSENNKELDIKLNDLLQKNTKYLIMFFSINTSEGDEYSVKNYIYDFETENVEEKVVEENKELNNNIEQQKELEKVALNSASTPDTGPETGILLLLTFILSSFVYFRKKA